jgi:hypothetical protein
MRMRHGVPLVVVGIAAAAMFVMLVRLRPHVARATTTALTPPLPAPRVPPPPAPPPPGNLPVSYPRLTHGGFTGMTPDEMVSRDAMVRAFPGLTVQPFDPPELVLLDANGYEVATVYGGGLGAYKVSVVGRSITTEHGISVGAPLSDVLKLSERHRCELVSSLMSSAGPVYRAIRCWVGQKPARFRYVASLGEERFGTEAALLDLEQKSLEPLKVEEKIPRDGKALERWIAATDVRIDQILWRNDLELER